MVGTCLSLLLWVFISSVRSKEAPSERAEVTIRLNCVQWNSRDKVPCDISGTCLSKASVCFSYKRGQASSCSEYKGFSRKLYACSNPHARKKQIEVFRLSQRISNVSKDLFFNVFMKRISSDLNKSFQASVQVLPNLKATSRGKWLVLPSSPPVKDFVLVSGRLRCLPPFSGPRCEVLDTGLLLSPGNPPSNGLSWSLETILAAAAAGCCLVVLFSLSVWCCAKRRRARREERRSAVLADPYDVYELPYEDLDQDRASYASVGKREKVNGSTLESSVEEGPELPPRRVSISSEDICARSEEEDDPIL